MGELRTTEKIVKGSIEQTSKGNLVLRLTLDSDSMDVLCLQAGKQPEGIIETLILYRTKGAFGQ